MEGAGPALLAVSEHAVTLSERGLPAGSLPLSWQLGSGLMALGLLTAVAGSAWRSRATVGCAAAVILAGAVGVAAPRSAVPFGMGLLALAAAAAWGLGGTLVYRGAYTGPAQRPEMERLRLRHGRTHISCFTGDGVKSGVRVEGGAIGYQVRWGVAVAVGDPLIPAEHRGAALAGFLALCDRQRWVPCFFQTDAALRPTYRASGFHLVKFGEEALVEVDRFDLASSSRAGARHEVARARRAGLEATAVWESQAPAGLWAEMEKTSRQWLADRGGREMGFSLGRLGDRVDTNTRYTVARDRSGRVHAFCSWVRMGGDGIALDLVRRRPDAAPGAVDLCIVDAIERARAEGLARLSLGSVPFRESRGDAPDGPLARRLRAALYRRGCGGYSYRGLSHFKAKFATGWESRDLVLPGGPSSALAIAALVRLHRGAQPAPQAASAPLVLGPIEIA